MKDITKSLIVVLVLIIGVIAVIYFTDFKFKKDIEYTNITIYATENGQYKITGYEIQTSNGTITGNTTYTPMIKVVPLEEIKVKNINLENQNYYIEEESINLTKDTNRINIQLQEQKDIIVEHSFSNPIQVNLSSQFAKDIDVCLRWSNAYIFVKPINLNKINIQNNLDCYDGNFSLKSSKETIEVEFTKLKTPTESDFIELIVLSDENLENQKIVKIR